MITDVREYVLSIVNCFDSPNIKTEHKLADFALNRKFKITKLIPDISGTKTNSRYELKKDGRMFKDFPVFLFDEYRKKDIYTVSPLPSKKTKIPKSSLKSMLNSDISYIFLNADNDDENIMNFNFYSAPLQLKENISNDLRYLIREYIVYLEDNINCTRIISHKNEKLVRLHNEIFYEMSYNAFGDFLTELRAQIEHTADHNIEDYVHLCRHIKYTDVINLYEQVKYNTESRDESTSNTFNMSKFRKLFDTFKNDILDINNADEAQSMKDCLEAVNILSSYFKWVESSEYDFETSVKERIPKREKKELKKMLKEKFRRFKEKYRERLLARFADSMQYNTVFFEKSIDYAKKAMNAHKQECGKTTLKYCTSLLAATHGFMSFLREKYCISEDICSEILNRVENLYKVPSYSSELKAAAPELKVQLFRNFLKDCRKYSADAVELKGGWTPIYTEEDACCIVMNGKAGSIQPIGWYNINQSEFVFIKKGENSPVEVAFKKYLEKRQYNPNFVWCTFVSSELYPNGIAKRRGASESNSPRYDFRRTIEGKQHTVYRMKG